MRILLVEDNGDVCSSLLRLLKTQGYEVQTCDNGVVAVQLVKTFQPELVLLDISLVGDMDGWQVCETMRADPKTNGTLICALSGYGAPDDIARSTQVGMNRHFVKPLFLGTLKAFLAEHGH